MMPLVSFFLLRAKGSNPHINTLPQIMTAKLKGWQWMREKHTWRKQTLKAGIDGLWHNWTLKPDESFFKVPFYFRTQWSMLFKGNWRKCSRFHKLTLLVYVCQASVFKPQHSLYNLFNYIFFHCLPVKTNRRLLPHCLKHNNNIKLHSVLLFKKSTKKKDVKQQCNKKDWCDQAQIKDSGTISCGITNTCKKRGKRQKSHQTWERRQLLAYKDRKRRGAQCIVESCLAPWQQHN